MRNDILAARIPIATYRLQFNGQFRFSDATEIIPYLSSLGISDIYASPYFRARKGSQHGYDIIDHNTLNPEIGSGQEYDEMIAALQRHGMGQLMDIVPNHMCVESSENQWWMDVLENGPGSLNSGFFDIDWTPIKQTMRDKVLLPILGDQYGAVLENKELQLVFDEGAFLLQFHDLYLPIMTSTYSSILSYRLEKLQEELGIENVDYIELLSVMTAIEHLPIYTEREASRVAERYREKEVIKRRLTKLCKKTGTIRDFIAVNVQIFNGEKGVPSSFDLIDKLLREQVYRVSYWRVATEEINYRRFFDINALGAIRVEKAEVFAAIHRLVFTLVREGKVTGLRVDHADGLFNPSEYLFRLQTACMAHSRIAGRSDKPLDNERLRRLEERYTRFFAKFLTANPEYHPFYIVCEKILMHEERLPGDWPVFGETGYSFVDKLNGIFVAAENAKAFDKIYRRFIRTSMNLQDVIYEKKKLVMQAAMSSEINTLGHYLNAIADINRHTLDFTLQSLIKALVEVIAFFPVYRTYIYDFEITERDRQYIEYAITRAKRKNPAISASIFDFIKNVLLLNFYENIVGDDCCRWLDFTMRFQQITGPVMAKGMEDTSYYLFNRLVSLNEVGGGPERFGLAVTAFHDQNQERSSTHPHSMLTTSTHDTKRSEDVRARINVLSEIPLAWREGLRLWSRINRRYKQIVEGQLVPDRNEEYLLYQTLIGAWPLCSLEEAEFTRFRQRIKEYMLKALREAKVNTSWINPNIAYEEAVTSFIGAILKKTKTNHFIQEMEKFQAITAACGMFNSLSQTLLKVTSPGVPDFYQGSELWYLRLVDPDNRGPVDYQLRQGILEELMRQEEITGRQVLAKELLDTRRDGRIKLYLIRSALLFRYSQRALFEKGAYLPLAAGGEKADNVCAFARTWEDAAVIIVAPRFFTRLIAEPDALPCGSGVWGSTYLLLPFDPPGNCYRNIFTGETVTGSPFDGQTVLHLAGIAASFPVALLERIPENV